MTRWDQLETERKYAPSRERAEEIVTAAQQHLRRRVYDPARPIAYARTTYLDTEQLSYLRSASGGVRQRLRLREYAGAARLDEPAALTGTCFLELKVSAGTKRAKTRLAASAEAVGRELHALAVAPTLTVWYRRVSLTDEREQLRVTLDTDIEFSRPGAAPASIVAGPACILEVKHRDPLPEWLAALVASLGEPQPLSKYDLGMAALQSASEAASSASRSSCSRVSTEPGRSLLTSAIAASADIPSDTK